MATTALSDAEVTALGQQQIEALTLGELHITDAAPLSRSSFPPNFLFGTSSSAYQIEGGAYEGGKVPTTWDTDCKAGKILDGSTGDVACDSYHRYEEDVDLMVDIGFNAYRFSIAWSRIISGNNVNQEGVNYYDRVIDYLLQNGIEPWVTLNHFDLPQELVDRFGGWFGSEIIPAFAAYAEVCFKAFGDRVKRWITVNEPTIDLYINSGYRGTSEESVRMNTSDRRYQGGHNMLLAHAAAVKIFREKYQKSSECGIIGISLDIQWYEPHTNSPEDINAAETAFRGGWMLDPLFFGRYPALMQRSLGDRLPSFTPEESELVKGSLDFIGVNYYCAQYAASKPMVGFTNETNFPVEFPSSVYIGEVRDGVPIGSLSASGLRVVPAGLEKVLMMLKTNYNNPTTYVTENGFAELTNPNLTLEEILQDEERVQFYHDHLCAALRADKNGADIRGFFAWSIIDNFEWMLGYKYQFGIHYVDFANNLRRHPKKSALWYKQLLRHSQFDEMTQICSRS